METQSVNTQMFQAIHRGDLAKVQELVNTYGLQHSRPWSKGYVLLLEALKYGEREISKFLLTKGCKIYTCNTFVKTPLHLVVKKGDLEILQMLLERNAKVNAIDSSGRTPLHIAVSKKNLVVCDMLLKHGADVQISDNSNSTPLFEAINDKSVRIVTLLLEKAPSSVLTIKGRLRIVDEELTPLEAAIKNDNLEIVQLILNKNSDVSYKGQDTGKTAVHFAAKANSSILNKIIECGGDVNAQDKDGNTPLHFAAHRGDISNVEALLKHGADSNVQDKDGKTPIHFAAEKDFFQITDILIKHGAKIDIPDSKGKLPIHSAAEKGSSKIIEHLIEHGALVDSILPETMCDIQERGFTPLFLAILSKRLSSVESVVQLLRSGANVNVIARNGQTVLYTAVETDQLEIVKEILKHNPDVSDEGNKKALIQAVFSDKSNSKLIGESLLEYGLTISSEISKDANLLFRAVKKGHTKLVKQLMEVGANANSEVDGKPVSQTALEYKDLEIAEVLLEHGAVVKNDLLHRAIKAHKTDFVDLFLRHGADPNVADPDGKTALHVYCDLKIYSWMMGQSSKIDIMSKLLEHGALINIQTIKGNTPLHEIIISTGSGSQKHNAVEFLCGKGAQVNIKNDNGDTPLHCAAASSDTKTGLVLLKHGALIHSRNNQGRTPLHIACYEDTMVKVLLKHGADVDCKDHDGNSPLEIYLQLDLKPPLFMIGGMKIFQDSFKLLLEYSSKSIHTMTKIMRLLLRLPQHAEYTNKMIFSFIRHVTLLAELGFCFGPGFFNKLAARGSEEQYERRNTTGDEEKMEVDLMTKLCKKEVEVMKKKEIGDSGVSFYDFLRKSVYQVATCLKKTYFFEYLQQSNYKTLFPSHAKIIEIHIWKGKMRQDLLTEVNNKWNCLFEGLPYDCVQEILSYLDDVDLSALIQIFPSIKHPVVEKLPSPPLSPIYVQPSTSSTFSMYTYNGGNSYNYNHQYGGSYSPNYNEYGGSFSPNHFEYGHEYLDSDSDTDSDF